MTYKIQKTPLFILTLALCMIVADHCVYAAQSIIEETRTISGLPHRIQVRLTSGLDEKSAREIIGKAFLAGAVVNAQSGTMGSVIDREVAILTESGVKYSFVNSDAQMFSMGMKSDTEMWKAWIPHPTDKKKVFAILRLKDKAIATVRNKVLTASVVADTTAEAEKQALELLIKGEGGLEAAEAMGVDALLIMKDGKKLKLGMAGGFKEQYGKAKK